MESETVHAIIEGKVQGVYFRECTRIEAEKTGLTGWVRNLPDGTVEAILKGSKVQIDLMRKWLQTGSPLSQVSKVSIQPFRESEIFSDFRIRY